MKKNKIVRKTRFSKILTTYRIVVVVLITLLLMGVVLYIKKEPVNVQKIVKNEIVNPNILMLGDSITEMYDLNEFYGEDKLIVNSGISGNRADGILNDLKQRAYIYNPSKVFLLIGINDILWDEASEDYVYDKTIEIVEHVKEKLPNTQIYIESIYPINSEMNNHFNPVDIDRVKSTVVKVNEKLKDYSKDNPDIKYIDLYSELLNENEELNMAYSDDGLHPNEEGYKIITDILKKYM